MTPFRTRGHLVVGLFYMGDDAIICICINLHVYIFRHYVGILRTEHLKNHVEQFQKDCFRWGWRQLTQLYWRGLDISSSYVFFGYWNFNLGQWLNLNPTFWDYMIFSREKNRRSNLAFFFRVLSDGWVRVHPNQPSDDLVSLIPGLVSLIPGSSVENHGGFRDFGIFGGWISPMPSRERTPWCSKKFPLAGWVLLIKKGNMRGCI